MRPHAVQLSHRGALAQSAQRGDAGGRLAHGAWHEPHLWRFHDSEPAGEKRPCHGGAIPGRGLRADVCGGVDPDRKADRPSVESARALTPEEILEWLGGVPPGKEHVAHLACGVLRDALRQ
jgi:hypothetical protein